MQPDNNEPDRLRALEKHLRECLILTDDVVAMRSLLKCADEITDRRQQLMDERRRDPDHAPMSVK